MKKEGQTPAFFIMTHQNRITHYGQLCAVLASILCSNAFCALTIVDQHTVTPCPAPTRNQCRRPK